MWQWSALPVTCVLALVLADTTFDEPRYLHSSRDAPASAAYYRRPVSTSHMRKSVSREVKRVVPNRRESQGIRGTRNTFYPIEEPPFQDDVGQTAQGLVVESSRLNIQAPPSRKYYNPALKKTPFPFNLPVEQPYPFQSTAFGGLYPLELPTGSGLQLQDGLVPTTAAGLPPTAIASFSPTPIDFTSPGFVGESWRSFPQQIPVSAPSVIPNYSTRPPWIPRGGKSDFKPQRGNLQTGGASGNQVVVTNTKRPSGSSGSISDLIKQVELFIVASNQNTNSTNTTNNTTIPNFKTIFKHPSVG